MRLKTANVCTPAKLWVNETNSSWKVGEINSSSVHDLWRTALWCKCFYWKKFIIKAVYNSTAATLADTVLGFFNILRYWVWDMKTLISCGDTAYTWECFLASLNHFTNCPQCVERLRAGTSSSIRVGCPAPGTHLLQGKGMALGWGSCCAGLLPQQSQRVLAP